MKKTVFCIIPLMLVIMGCASSGGAVATAAAETNTSSAGIDLDAAIREAAAQTGENLPGGMQVALVSVASSSAQLSEYIISRLEAALVNGKKLTVVDRANLDKVREEQGFQLSGEVDDNSAKNIGKLLGAGAIVTGAFADLGDVYTLTLKAINIETATVAVSYPADIAKSARIETMLASGGGGAVTRTAQTGGSTAPAAPSQPVAQVVPDQPAAQVPAAQSAPDPAPKEPAKVYKIGDTGPAGGIVFYDKGNSSDGWRYLEAAPAETEKRAPFYVNYSSPKDSAIVANLNTEESLGAGKKNTNVILSYLASIGQWDMAAQVCDDLEFNGYSDWYMPSFIELSLIYGNLYRKGLGDFKSEVYYSSTLETGRFGWDLTLRSISRSFNFADGSSGGYYTEGAKPVRAIRQF
jgi:hypothetical protein